MFTTLCFIRNNTPKLRKCLKNLGYAQIESLGGDSIFCYPGMMSFAESYFQDFPQESLVGYTNCENNESLFKAISALRDDSDYMQWFVCDEPINIYNNKVLYIGDYFQVNDDKFNGSIVSHKATVEELVIHFKNKQKNKQLKNESY